MINKFNLGGLKPSQPIKGVPSPEPEIAPASIKGKVTATAKKSAAMKRLSTIPIKKISSTAVKTFTGP